MSFILYTNIQNLLVWSEDFLQTEWTVIGAPVRTSNFDIAPNGESTATKIEDTTAITTAVVKQVVTQNNDTYTASVYIKKDTTPRTTRFCAISIQFEGSTVEASTLNLDTSTGEFDINEFTPGLALSTKVELIGNYYRLSITAKTLDTNNTTMTLLLFPAAGASADFTSSSSALGSFIVWGAQISNTSSTIKYQKTTITANVADADVLEVTPEFSMEEGGEKIEARHRTRDGSEFVYKWGEFSTIKIDVRFVNSNFKSKVNEWWSSNTELLFSEFDGFDVTSVHITNKKKPINKFQRPYIDLFNGKIELGTY